MTEPRGDAGYSLVEILVALSIFSLVASAFMSVMLSGARSSDATRANVRVAEEARVGLNRMVRDTREAGWIQLPSPNPGAIHDSFTVKVDYNGDGAYANPPGPGAPADGNYEVVTYAYDDPGDRITVTAAGFATETVVNGVDCVRPAPGAPCESSVFSFTSNRLEYDITGPAGQPDGVTTLSELNDVACPSYNVTAMDGCNGVLVDKELANITSVNFALSIRVGTRSTNYYAEAQLRNRR